MGRGIEVHHFNWQTFTPYLAAGLFGMAAMLPNCAPPPAKSEQIRSADHMLKLGRQQLDIRPSEGSPKPGEVWIATIPDGQYQIKLDIEVLEYVTVTYVRPEGETTLPSYCRGRITKTGKIIILDFHENPEIKLVRKIPQ